MFLLFAILKYDMFPQTTTVIQQAMKYVREEQSLHTQNKNKTKPSTDALHS